MCTTMMRVTARCSWTSCSRFSSPVSITTAAGVSTGVEGDAVRRPERLAERRRPPGGAGGEQDLLGRQLGDDVVVAALRRPG